MAINFGYGKETLFASTDLMSFGKAFSRMAAQPLDMYEVWYDYDALVAYAANTDSSTATAYVGQKVAYIDADNKVFHYSIEADGSLKEIGTSPVGDESSITVDENGTVSLKGVGTLVFEREVEGGEKVEVKFQPLMTKNGLVWVEPSAITVEDLKDLIDALDGRVEALENWKAGLVEKTETGEGSYIEVSVATENGEVKSVSVDDSALANFKTKQTAVNNADGSTTKTVTGYTQNENGEVALTYADIAFPVDENTEYHIEYDSDNKKIKLVAGADAGKMEIDATPFIKDGMISSVELVAEDAEGNKGQFLKITWNDDGEDVTYVNISELINVEELNSAIAGKADKTELDNYVTKTVYDAHLETQSEKDAAQDKALTDYKAEMVETLKGYQTTIPAETYDAYGSAAQALADAKKYADDNKVAKVDGYGLLSSADQAKLDKLTLEDGNLSISGSVEAGSVKNLDTWLTTNRDTVAGLYPAADATKLAGVAAGAQVNVLEGVQVDGADLAINGKKVNIELAGIREQANKGVADAATAQSKANSAYELASANKTEAERIAPIVAEHTTSIADHKSRIEVVEGTSTNHEGRIATLEGKASANEGNITALQTTVGEHTQSLATINSTLTNHDGRITTNAGNITNLQKALTGYETEGSVKTAIDAAAAKGIAAQGTADSALAKANENAGLIAGLTTASNTNTQNIAKNAENIGKNSEAIAENTRLIGVNDAAIKENTRLIGVNAAAIEAHQTSVASEIQRVDGLVSGLDTRMGTAETKISTLESQVTNAMHFRGISSQDPTVTTDLNGTQQGPAIEGVTSYAAGDVVIYNHLEYVFDGSKWSVLGDESSYALKNNVYTRSEIDATVLTINGSIASAYANAKSEAIADAKAYTDTEIGKLNETVAENYNELVEHANGVAADAETNAKAYADSILAAALSWQDMPALDAE